MDSTEKEILNTFISLVKKKIDLDQVILFGSRARGDAAPDSDMDVLVVAEEISEPGENYISDCAWEAGFKHGIVLVPIVFSRAEWESGPERHSSLAEVVKSEGIYL
jgi:phosphopantetheine adenylyltransferase